MVCSMQMHQNDGEQHGHRGIVRCTKRCGQWVCSAWDNWCGTADMQSMVRCRKQHGQRGIGAGSGCPGHRIIYVVWPTRGYVYNKVYYMMACILTLSCKVFLFRSFKCLTIPPGVDSRFADQLNRALSNDVFDAIIGVLESTRTLRVYILGNICFVQLVDVCVFIWNRVPLPTS